jgi:transglutaminase-like putative cysteine protease
MHGRRSIPVAGWITFDPTNRGVGGLNLVPVAVARTIGQTAPVVGNYAGASDAFESMTVDVAVTG